MFLRFKQIQLQNQRAHFTTKKKKKGSPVENVFFGLRKTAMSANVEIKEMKYEKFVQK